MKKVLVIAYYWPPAGGPGVQRWLKFVEYLPQFGFSPIVYVPENASYPIVDESLLEEIPKNVKILKQPISEPYKWASFLSGKKTKRISSGIITEHPKQSFVEKILLWIRGNLFIPDARKSWVKPSVDFLRNHIQKENVQTVITTGPPHSLHLIGFALKYHFPNIQWVTDFRDPWTSIGYHKKLKLTKRSKQKHKTLEKGVLNECDKVIVTSATTKEEFEIITQKPIRVITNGYEPTLKNEKVLDTSFTISHIGSMLTDRNPDMLWKVLSELVSENAAFKENLKIQLIGVVGASVIKSLYGFGLESYVDRFGYVSHNVVQKYQQRSQVLLLAEIDSPETRGIIPGKLFEYMDAGRPILALGPKNWEAGELVESTNSGVYFEIQNAEGLKELLLNWFSAYQKGALKNNTIGHERYTREALTQSLSDFITWESS